MEKTQFNGETFEKTKEGLYLPRNVRRNLRPTAGEKIVDALRKPLIYGATALTLASGVSAYSADSNTQDNSVYSGVVIGEGEANSILDVTNKRTGLHMILQGDASNDNDFFLNNGSNYDSRSSINSGNILGNIQFEGAYNHSESDAEECNTSLLKYSPRSLFSLMGGVVTNSVSRGFVGGRIDAKVPGLEKLTANGSIINVGAGNNFQGYVAGQFGIGENTKFYASIGGKTKEDKIFNLVGLDGNGWGAYHFMNIDNQAHEQSGKLLLVPSGTSMGVDFFDIGGQYFTAPDHRDKTNLCAWGWIPPDLFKVDGKTGHNAFAINWENTQDDFDVSGTFWHRWNPGLGGGITLDFKRDKDSRIWTPKISPTVHTTIPDTPFEVQFTNEHNLRTGESESSFHGGVNIGF